MLNHVVLLKLKKGTGESQIEQLYQGVLKLKYKIPEIESVSVGKNDSPEKRNHGFTHGFIVRFGDSKARDVYLSHPEHQRIANTYIFPIADDVLVFDLEM